MKVLHINTMDEGGAAVACTRIHLGLLAKGIDSKILLLKKKRNISETYRFEIIKKSFLDKVFLKLKYIFIKNEARNKMLNMSVVEIFSYPTSAYNILNHPLYKEADIIQLNWVSGFLDEPSFFANNTKPVVWRMPDLYACGGGNHYEVGFPFNLYENELKANTEIRRKFLNGKNITFVPISNWVKQKAENSVLIADFPKKLIHNGLDFSIFKPIDKKVARELFNLPQDKPILLIGADKLNVPRKGLKIALEAIGKMNLKDYNIVIFGNVTFEIPEKFIYLGAVTDERLLPALYSAADYFLMTSIEEAFGQVTIEALACGVPVISFPNGGSVDIIKNNINGILAKDFTAEALVNAINLAFLTNFDSEIIIKDVKLRFNIIDKVKEYIELYKMVLNE